MDADFWDSFYADQLAVTYPSPFATFCDDTFIPPASTVLELGSGSGRDSVFFFERGHRVVAIEQSQAAVDMCNERMTSVPENERIRFTQGDFTQLHAAPVPSVDAVYSRFTLHSITKPEQDRVLASVFELLPRAGMFMVEARTINDPYYGKGEKVGEHEFVTDHYRRHLDAQVFLAEVMDLGFEVRFFHESTGLARFRGEDPVVLRAVLTKSPFDPPLTDPA